MPTAKPITKGQAVKWSDLCDEWLDQKKLCLKQSSYAQYGGIMRRHILPHWGRQNINELTADRVNSFIKSLSDRLSAKTVRDILNVFLQVVRFAEKKHGVHIDLEEIARPKVQAGYLPVLSPDNAMVQFLFRKSRGPSFRSAYAKMPAVSCPKGIEIPPALITILNCVCLRFVNPHGNDPCSTRERHKYDNNRIIPQDIVVVNTVF